MKKHYYLLLLLPFFFSCSDQNSNPELQSSPDTSLLPSTSISFLYPTGTGTSGETKNGLLGYGYDATGFCDTISVRAKVFESLPGGDIYFGNPSTVSPTIVNGNSFTELINKINLPYSITGSGTALTFHLKSLLKLAYNSDSIAPDYAYTYYAMTYYNSHNTYHYGSDSQQYLSSEFKSDVVAFTPKELVSKYGTHVLMDVYSGTKFEVLYRCKFADYHSGSDCEELFYNRMNEYIGGTPGIVNYNKPTTKFSQTDEQLIYNSQGSRIKLCGLIHATDNNSDSIRLNINSLFSDKNIKTQFILIGTDGILPLYELINDETKKLAIKAYIERYMSGKTVN